MISQIFPSGLKCHKSLKWVSMSFDLLVLHGHNISPSSTMNSLINAILVWSCLVDMIMMYRCDWCLCHDPYLLHTLRPIRSNYSEECLPFSCDYRKAPEFSNHDTSVVCQGCLIQICQSSYGLSVNVPRHHSFVCYWTEINFVLACWR